MIEDYTEKEIEKVIKSFSSYIKLIVKHAAIDYTRKVKSQKYSVISFNECVEKEMSLSNNDSDIFSFIDKNTFSNNKYNLSFEKLSKKEQKILILYSENFSVNEISKIMKITENNVKSTKSIAINKFKKFLKESEIDEN